MFDATTPDTAPTTAGDDRASLERLCRRYDSLLEASPELTPAQGAELAAMAGIFDLDVERPPRELWADLREVLLAQTPRVQGEPAVIEAAAPLTLMVVEDDPEMAQDLTALLIEAGHDVVGPFHSAEAAEAAAGLHRIDVALLDINLSGEMDGGTLARRLADRWGLKVVFLSGDVTAAAGHADVAQAMVIKPYRGADVLAALRQVGEATV